MHRHVRALLGRCTYANLMSTLAVVLVIGGGTAYAANTVFSSDIVDGEVKTPDLGSNAVTTIKIKAGGVTNPDLAADAADGSKVLDDSLTSADLAPASVGSSELAANAVDGSSVTDESLSLNDLVGANTSGAISFTLGAHSCGTLSYGISGAQVGQGVLMSFTGTVAIPDVMFGPMRVVSAGTVSGRACNQSSSSVSVSNMGVRFITFG
jgi:hypothetical protein